ncbi:Endoglucanase 1 [Vigna angularis]|uniref:cellulase n=1 Tax=Phaseolus angularis TaxID=3914 RepID=A0A8T0KFJ5_PHAAN|nr:Endoglucanase 1 [Vigna angularis]
MLAWSVIEFGDLMDSELKNALDAIRWGTDYLMKATKNPYLIVAQVGDPNADHDCSERPEDMDTPRTSYFLTKQKPGSELAAEIAAALSASSIAFRKTNASYSNILIKRAIPNPAGMLYMVGYGRKYPRKIHHRGSVLPCLDAHPQRLRCRDGDVYFKSDKPNLNVLTGALVGGPAEDDSFQDSRFNVSQSEPTTYINAPLLLFWLT